MTDTQSISVIVILGIIEGLSEFFPISSSGHMIIIGHLLGFEGEIAKTIEIIIQPGATLAIVIIFWKRLLKLINIHFEYLFQCVNHQKRKNHLTLIHIFLSMIPSSILGLLFHDTIKSLFNPINVLYALVTGSLFLVISEYLKPKKPYVSKIDDMTYLQAFIIGCFQCLALFPGFSRSGATISGGMLIGISRCAAAEFSFLLSVPIMIGAAMLEFYKSKYYLTIDNISIFIVGFIITFITALISIRTFLKLIKYISFIPFAIYRFIIAIVVYLIIF